MSICYVGGTYEAAETKSILSSAKANILSAQKDGNSSPTNPFYVITFTHPNTGNMFEEFLDKKNIYFVWLVKKTDEKILKVIK